MQTGEAQSELLTARFPSSPNHNPAPAVRICGSPLRPAPSGPLAGSVSVFPQAKPRRRANSFRSSISFPLVSIKITTPLGVVIFMGSVDKKDTRFLSSIILDAPLSTYPSWVLYYLCFFSALDFNPVSQDSKIGMIITVETNSKNFKVGESLSK